MNNQGNTIDVEGEQWLWFRIQSQSPKFIDVILPADAKDVRFSDYLTSTQPSPFVLYTNENLHIINFLKG